MKCICLPQKITCQNETLFPEVIYIYIHIHILLNISKAPVSSLKALSIIPISNIITHIKSYLLQLLAFRQSQWEYFCILFHGL